MHICCLNVSRYIKGGKKIASLNTIEFLDPYVCINNPHWQSNGNIIFLCKYYIVISDTLVGSFFYVLFFLLVVILPQVQVKPRRKDRVSEKIYRKICVKGINFLTALPPFCAILCCFLRLLPSFSQMTYLLYGSYGWCSVMISWVNGGKYENLLQFYFSWLPAIKTWYYFRLHFSFSCFVFDLILIRKSHTLNCYLFLHNFLLKTKITNSLLVTLIIQFTAKMTNLEKAIYFLSIRSCSINRLKSHLLFTHKNFLFYDFIWNFIILLQEMVGERRGRGRVLALFCSPAASPAHPFVYGPASYWKTTLTIWPNMKARGQKSQFSNFLLNWGKFANVI